MAQNIFFRKPFIHQTANIQTKYQNIAKHNIIQILSKTVYQMDYKRYANLSRIVQRFRLP